MPQKESSRKVKFSQNELNRIPKIELHIHLDCSLSFDVISQLLPGTTQKEYMKDFTAPEKCIDIKDYFRCVSKSITLMQTEAALRAVVKGLFTQLRKDNVIYAEIRFAPFSHLRDGLAPEDVVEIVADSISKNCKATGIQSRLILCTLRNYSEEQSFKVIKLVDRYINKTCVVGFDIAGDEVGFPIGAHIKSFDYANKHDIPTTAHAGESKGAESVWETLTYFKPQRIGHGVRSIKDEKLVDHLVENQIHLEICPTSNIKTNVFKVYLNHPIDLLFDLGVSLSINTDGRSSAIFSLTEEYEKLASTFNWDLDFFYQCNINAISHAFLSPPEKAQLAQRYISEFHNTTDI